MTEPTTPADAWWLDEHGIDTCPCHCPPDRLLHEFVPGDWRVEPWPCGTGEYGVRLCAVCGATSDRSQHLPHKQGGVS